MKAKLILSSLSLVGLALYSQSSWALCKIASSKFQHQDVNMMIGNITLDPNVGLGQNYISKRFTIENKANSAADCDFWGGKGIGKILIGSPTAYPNVYTTNVQGIGVRLYRDSGIVQTFYPHFSEVNDGSTLAPGQFIVDIVKIDQVTGSGPLTSGRYSIYYLDGDGPGRPRLTSTLDANGIVLVNPTCSIDQTTNNQTIDMGSIRASQLTAIGQTANERNVTLRLNCNGGNIKVQKVKLGFNYQADLQQGAKAVIANRSGIGDAKGIGIQLVASRDQSLVTNGRSVDVASTILNGTTYPELKLTARYYKTEANITPGEVYATVTFNIQYQ